MTATTNPSPATRRRPTGAPAFAAAVASAAVVSVALCAVIAAVAHGAGASHSFTALDFPAYTFFIVVGLIAGAAAWTIVRKKAADPATLLGWLAPVVVVLSFVPDVIVGATDSLTGSSWGAVLALMVMHLVVAVCGVASYRFFLPLTDRT